MQANYDRLWIGTRSVKSSRKIERRLSINTRTLISINVTISNCKIKAKSETLIKALNKNHVTLVTHVILVKLLDKTEVDQKIIFSSKNVIIAEKIIFVLDVIIWIIQLKTANICLTQIKHLQKKIKSNYSLLKHDWKNALELRSYTLAALVTAIKLITALLTTQNLTSIDLANTQKTS